ncbi:sugar nucleotide-binding protein [Pseudomonas mosselii]|uniref:SDR family oxidoreductase n=1 Tax=Pseudomonas mosselii TaxID=78327 RepID=UPI0024490306|nr:sugar nucleotide-binding protein [Pseudomonas mosselii]MDH1147168.1 sugar nucleotide-binding protein [Pseudomonas mosselii]
MKIAVTGATGYIGQQLVKAALNDGVEVLALSRRPLAGAGLTWQQFDLNDSDSISLPDGTTAIFHLAADTGKQSVSEHIEAMAASRLVSAAEKVGAIVVFVSSQTAREDAPTAYGRTKWLIERRILDAGGLVVRPGQVYGGAERGLFGVLCGLVRRLPVLPAFIPEPQVQPVHVNDLARALLNFRSFSPASIICIAAPKSVGFTAFLRAIARGRTRRYPLTLPVPTLLLTLGSKLVGATLSEKLGLSRLESLFALRPMETESDLGALGFELRSMATGMARSGQGRRELLREGRSVLAYVLRAQPEIAMVRRYARVIETLRSGQSIELPEYMLRMPSALALLDGFGGGRDNFKRELDWRLGVALMLTEATPQGGDRYLASNGPVSALLRISRAAFSELFKRILQLGLWPVLARIGRKGMDQ